MANKEPSANKRKKRSYMGEVWHRMKRNKGAMVALTILAIMVITAILAGFLIDYDTQIMGYDSADRLMSPCLKHPFGTDEMGRDIFVRILYGARYSMTIGFVAVAIVMVLSMILGATAGYCGGKVEMIIMRLTDIFNGIPYILMAIVIVSTMGQSMLNLMIAVGISHTPKFIRITQASVLTTRNAEYIEACRAIGLKTHQIILKHIIPNSLAPILVSATMLVGGTIISAASLSYIGLGIPSPLPEWGAMLSAGRNFIRQYPYMTFFPGLAIMTTVLCFNLVGDALRDALDPKLK